MKKLSDILAAHGINTVPSGVFPRLPEEDLEAKNNWKYKSPDEQNFADKHEVRHFEDRNGNGDDIFNASNITPVDRPSIRHGYNPGADVAVYEEAFEAFLEDLEEEDRDNILAILEEGSEEEVDELLTELKKSTLGNYIKAASELVGDLKYTQGFNHGRTHPKERLIIPGSLGEWRQKRIARNKEGIERAVSKLTKEDREPDNDVDDLNLDIDTKRLEPKQKCKWCTQKFQLSSDVTAHQAQAHAKELAAVRAALKNQYAGITAKPMREEEDPGTRCGKCKKKISKQDDEGGRCTGCGTMLLPITAKGKDLMKENQIDEVLKPSMGASAYIHDFVHSTDPRFKGKSRKERINMALGAYYGAKNEEIQEAKKEKCNCPSGKPSKDKDSPYCKKCGYEPVEEQIDEAKCECGDPGCPIHKGSEKCSKRANKKNKIYRSDMEDETGTVMCPGCTADAMDSGVFHVKEQIDEELLNETVPTHYLLQKFGYRRMGRNGEWTQWTDSFGRGNSNVYVNEDGINWSHDIEDKRAVASGKGPMSLRQRLEEYHPVKKKTEKEINEELDEYLDSLSEDEFLEVMSIIEEGSSKEIDNLIDYLSEAINPNVSPATMNQTRRQANSQSKPPKATSNANPATIGRSRIQANTLSKPKPTVNAGDYENNELIEGKHEVIVGNIGTVYSGGNAKEAAKHYKEYVGQSQSVVGRAAGEDVTHFVNGYPHKEHYGRNWGRYKDNDNDEDDRGIKKSLGIKEDQLEESRKKVHGYKKYDIYLNGKLVDSVSHDSNDSNLVRNHLVKHSGYDQNIVVRKHR